MFLLIGLIFSCSNDFDLTEERRDIPVVYGLLNPTDTAQYIRIERAFIDDSISALEIAQRPDSLYYESLDASLVNVNTEERFQLTRVDGNLEGYPRNEGVFAQAPNYLYKAGPSEFTPLEGETYRLEINRGDGLDLITAETLIVDNPVLVSPPPGQDVVLNFRYNLENPAFVEPLRFEWKITEGVIFDIRMNLKYIESVDGGPFEQKSIVWPIVRSLQELETSIQGIEFYAFLAANIEEDPSAIRLFQNLDLILDSGGQTILDFINIGQANLGITSSQDIPTFTNLSEGVGLFSSRNSLIRENIGVTPGTQDSLRFGSITGHLNFQ
jgi:hypothetical protein